MSKLLTSTEVAERVGYSVKHFQNAWRSIKGLPAPVRLQLASGGLSNPKWRESDVDAFLSNLSKVA